VDFDERHPQEAEKEVSAQDALLEAFELRGDVEPKDRMHENEELRLLDESLKLELEFDRR